MNVWDKEVEIIVIHKQHVQIQLVVSLALVKLDILEMVQLVMVLLLL